MTEPTLESINQLLLERQLIAPGQRLLVGVSGGQDSIWLLYILDNLKPLWFWALGVVHCDHQWHARARDHACQVYRLVWMRRLRGYTVVPSRGSLCSETAARVWRSKNIRHVARDHLYEVVSLGHTASDRVETVLAHGLRGAGMQGLQALPWKRNLLLHVSYTLPSDIELDINQYNDIRYHWTWRQTVMQASLECPRSLIRPLLGCSRMTIRHVILTHRLPVCVDDSNYTLRWERNRIRHQLLPYLRTYFNPNIDRILAHAIDLIEEEHHYIQAVTNPLIGDTKLISRSPVLVLSHWRTLPLPIQRRVLRQLCAPEGTLSFLGLERLRWQLNQCETNGYKQWQISTRVRLILDDGKVKRHLELDTET